jgi:hypothetical protein
MPSLRINLATVILILAASTPNNSSAHAAGEAAQGAGDAPVTCGTGHRVPAHRNDTCADAKDPHRTDARPKTQEPRTTRGRQSDPDNERESVPFEPDRFWDWIQQHAQ